MATKKVATKKVVKKGDNLEEVKRTIIDEDHILVEYSDGSTITRIM